VVLSAYSSTQQLAEGTLNKLAAGGAAGHSWEVLGKPCRADEGN
jgi:hypothetical protein